MRWSVVLIGLVLVLCFGGVRLADPDPVRTLRHTYFDYLQRVFPRDWQDLPVRVVDIDEASLARIGQWPWPRDVLADLVDRLREQGAAVIAFDMLFAEPDRYSPGRLLRTSRIAEVVDLPDDPGVLDGLDTDRRFATALGSLPTALGIAAGEAGGGAGPDYDKAGFVRIGNDPLGSVTSIARTTPIVPVLAETAAGIGSINLSPLDAAAIVRRVPLVWQAEGGPLPSLSVEALRLAIGEGTYIVRGRADLARAMASLQVGGYTIPTTDEGELWVRFRRDDRRLYLSAAEVLAGEADLRDRLDGHIVLVGTSAAGLLDIRTTPLGERVPGVGIQAQVVEQILTEDYLIRSDTVAAAEVLSLLVLGLTLAVVMAVSGPIASVLTGGAGAALVLGGSLLAFDRAGLLFDASWPLLAGFATFALLTAYRFFGADRESRMIRRSFSQYLSPSVLAEIERRGYRIELGGEMREVTVMFCDIRNFTPLGERLAPPDLVSLLNDLFTTLTGAILDRGGTIDKYIGDNVMAFWNAPLAIPGHEAAAARAALDMRAAVRAFRGQGAASGQRIELATGLATGEALVGNIGSRQRFNYSVLGDTVNVAARVETACRHVGYDIVATEATRDAAADLAWLDAGRLALRGRSAATRLFLLVGDEQVARSEPFRALETAHAGLLATIFAGEETAGPLSTCRARAAAVDPGLAAFYDRVPMRAADFSQPAAQAATSPR